jgi:type IV secretory pathway VirD2 relaxase
LVSLVLKWLGSARLEHGASRNQTSLEIAPQRHQELTGERHAEARRLAIGRLQKLERMGLATAAGPGQWIVDLAAEPTLRDLGMRGDIIKTMHRAFTQRGQDRGVADYVIDSGTPSAPIIGRVVERGLHDELTGEAYAVIDGIDGRAYYVRFRGIEAFAEAPPTSGIVEVRRFGRPNDPRPTLVLASRSDFDLDRQVTAPGGPVRHDRQRFGLRTRPMDTSAREASRP